MSYTEREQKNLELVEGMLANVLGPLDSAHVDHFFRPDYIQHSPMADDGSAALKAFLDWAKDASPHYVHDVKRIIVDGDYVVVHAHTIREPGTLGFAVIDIFRVQNGLIAEHWDALCEVPAESRNASGMF
jgi:predicted SnoaL-like aldol condensation-catalyzing enzyme